MHAVTYMTLKALSDENNLIDENVIFSVYQKPDSFHFLNKYKYVRTSKQYK